MSTLTIELPDELAARLAAASERQHVPPSQIVQEALAMALSAPAETSEGKSLYDAMVEAGAFGCVSTGLGDLSTNPRHMEGYGQSKK